MIRHDRNEETMGSIDYDGVMQANAVRVFSERDPARRLERAALAWAEAVTHLANQEVPDEVYNQARAEFSETELAQLTLSVITINGWNRLNVAFRTPAGNYQSAIKQSAA
jgi:alkylhydroperoxidase family enzyme